MNAVERLRELPVIFSIKTLGRVVGGIDNARVYASRWKSAGYIESAGPKSGLYFNLIVNPKAREELAIASLLKLYPSAVLRGNSVLHAAGWITQIPARVEVAVLAGGRRTVRELTGFEIELRPQEWFQTVREAIDREGPYGLPALKPAWALADMRVREATSLEDDDLEMEPGDEAEIERALECLGASRKPTNRKAPR